MTKFPQKFLFLTISQKETERDRTFYSRVFATLKIMEDEKGTLTNGTTHLFPFN